MTGCHFHSSFGSTPKSPNLHAATLQPRTTGSPRLKQLPSGMSMYNIMHRNGAASVTLILYEQSALVSTALQIRYWMEFSVVVSPFLFPSPAQYQPYSVPPTSFMIPHLFWIWIKQLVLNNACRYWVEFVMNREWGLGAGLDVFLGLILCSVLLFHYRLGQVDANWAKTHETHACVVGKDEDEENTTR